MKREAYVFLLFCFIEICHAQSPVKLPNEYKSEQLKPFLEAATWTIFSVEPRSARSADDQFAKKGEPTFPADRLFHSHPILGQTNVSVTAELRSVITDLDEAGKNWLSDVAECFSPRHGIRVTKDGKTYDLVICYECTAAHIIEDGKQTGTLYFLTVPEKAPSPYKLNKVLRAAKIAIAPSRGETRFLKK